MATEALVAEVKRLVGLAKAGNADDAYKGYAALYRSAQFKTYPMEEQRSALKVIKRGMDSEAVLKRFLRERQILARLDHPNIAHLLDGGIAADGRPYFAMEYVEGLPLLRWCHERGTKLEERLDLFKDVCAAVQFALDDPFPEAEAAARTDYVYA